MDNQFVFQDQKEIQRLQVQNRLLRGYEDPIFARLFSGREGLCVLDIGCNDGKKTVERFSDRAVSRLIGLEYNPELALKAQQRYGNETFSFHHFDVEQPGFSSRLRSLMEEQHTDAFDVIYLSFLLMHLKDIKSLLSELHPFLKDGGTVIIVESNDPASTLNHDPEDLLGQFLAILNAEPYSGHRDTGGRLLPLLQELGYRNIRLWYDSVGAGPGEAEKKQDIATTFFSYLPEDIALLLAEDPDNRQYRAWADWLTQHYEKLTNLITKEDSVISMGMQFLTCTNSGT